MRPNLKKKPLIGMQAEVIILARHRVVCGSLVRLAVGFSSRLPAAKLLNLSHSKSSARTDSELNKQVPGLNCISGIHS
jgi:hypothetical protein